MFWLEVRPLVLREQVNRIGTRQLRHPERHHRGKHHRRSDLLQVPVPKTVGVEAKGKAVQVDNVGAEAEDRDRDY